MKAITKYQAADGAEFATESKCAAYEALCSEVAQVVAALPTLPEDDGCDFVNGHGYIQHDADTFRRAREALLKIAQRECPHHWIDDSLAKGDEVHASWAGRIIGDSSRPLYSAWNRIACTDKQFREWGQPYYAEHPEQAPEQRQVNA